MCVVLCLQLVDLEAKLLSMEDLELTPYADANLTTNYIRSIDLQPVDKAQVRACYWS